jgi:hypothetical protein
MGATGDAAVGVKVASSSRGDETCDHNGESLSGMELWIGTVERPAMKPPVVVTRPSTSLRLFYASSVVVSSQLGLPQPAGLAQFVDGPHQGQRVGFELVRDPCIGHQVMPGGPESVRAEVQSAATQLPQPTTDRPSFVTYSRSLRGEAAHGCRVRADDLAGGLVVRRSPTSTRNRLLEVALGDGNELGNETGDSRRDRARRSRRPCSEEPQLTCDY